MMERLGSPQTHLTLKAMIREVDEDGDNRISFREVGRYHAVLHFLTRYSYAVRRPWHRCRLSVCLLVAVTDVPWLKGSR